MLYYSQQHAITISCYSIVVRPFPKIRHQLGLMMNVDWHKPFKHKEYKVAGIFLTLLNLPREERNKKSGQYLQV